MCKSVCVCVKASLYKSVAFLLIRGMMVPSFFGNVCRNYHSKMRTHVVRSIMVPSLLCIFVAHIVFLAKEFYRPFILSLTPPSFSLWLQDTCHLMPFTKYPLLNQSYFFTPYLSIVHIKFTNYSPTIFYDYHPQSCLKNIFFALGPTAV